jgi:anti-anti-sigma regulatory factor
MFKLSIVETENQQRLVVEGKLVTPWTTEVESAWREANERLNGKRLVIDLTNVTVISRDGENLLLKLMKDGAKFAGKGVLTRHLLRKLARLCHCQPAADDNFGKAQTSKY